MRRTLLAVAALASGCGVGTDTALVTKGENALASAGVRVVSTVGLARKSPIHTGNGIQYAGGPVMHGKVTAYYIWYGNWTGNTARPILDNFIRNFGGSDYYAINTTYADAKGAIQNSVRWGGEVLDNYSQGADLDDNAVGSIVQSHAGVDLPYDTNGVYLVLTSSDVTESSGFCSYYCAWHGYQPLASGDLMIAFIGNAENQCAYFCDWEYVLPTPNQNVGADGMASMIAHEFEETTSDPEGLSWTNPDGSENADLCAWTFGQTYNLHNGSFANIHLGDRNYLIQQNWVNRRGGFCAMSRGN